MDFRFPQDIQGLIDFEEGRLLFQLAQINPHLGAVVELGCFHGRSTICLAQGSKKVGGGRVFTVDKFVGGCCIGEQQDFYREFIKNIKHYQLERNITAQRGDTVAVAKKWRGPIRFLFIDAGHSYKEVTQDFNAWGKYLVPGGIIAFHDSLFWPGVNKFVCQLITSGKYENFETFTHKSSPGITFAKKKVISDSGLTIKNLINLLKFKLISSPGLFTQFYLDLRENKQSVFFPKVARFMKFFWQGYLTVGRRFNQTTLIALIGLGIIWLIYWPVINGYFLGEDYAWWEYVQGKNISETLQFFLVSPSKTLAGFYHPLVGLLYWFNVNFSFMKPFWFHLTNLAIHIGVFLLVVSLAYSFFRKNWLSLLAGFLFAIFPFHSEAVAWIDGRHDLLTTFFYLLSFYLFLRWNEGRKRILLGASVFSFFLALSAKEMAVTLPLTLVFYLCFVEEGELIKRLKKAVKKTSWFWLVLIFYFFLHAAYVGHFNPLGAASHLGVIVPRILILYIVFFIISIVFYMVIRSREGWDKQKVELIPLLAILIGIFYLPGAFNPTQERYLYLPSTVVSLYLANLFYLVWQNKLVVKKKILQAGLFIGLFIVSGTSVIYLENRVSDWKKASEIAYEAMSQFKTYAKNIPSDSTIYFFNLPDNYHGSYIFRTHVRQAMEYGSGRKFKNMVVLPQTLGIDDSTVEIVDETRFVLKSKKGFLIFGPTVSQILPSGEKIIETEDYLLLVKDKNTLNLTLKKDYLGKEKVFFFKYDTSLTEIR